MNLHLPLAFLSNLFDSPDLLVVLAIGLLIFGRRLPEMGKHMGQAITGFKKGLSEVESEVKASSSEQHPKALPAHTAAKHSVSDEP